jgi:hypothetical protein
MCQSEVENSGFLYPLCIGKTLLIIFGAVVQEVPVLQQLLRGLLLLLHPVEITFIFPTPFGQKQGMTHETQYKNTDDQYGVLAKQV